LGKQELKVLLVPLAQPVLLAPLELPVQSAPLVRRVSLVLLGRLGLPVPQARQDRRELPDLDTD
jgi:hypothetical protein